MTVQAGVPTGVHIVLERVDGRILLMRRAGTGFFDGLFSLPGGHAEPGESIRATAVREIDEELGIRLETVDLDYLGVVHRLSDTNRIDFFVRARRWNGNPEICEPDKCDALDWFAPQDLPCNTVSYVRAALGKRPSPWFLETGWPSA